MIRALAWAARRKLTGAGETEPGVCLVCGLETMDEDADLCSECFTPAVDATLQGVKETGFRMWGEDHGRLPTLEQQDRSDR